MGLSKKQVQAIIKKNQPQAIKQATARKANKVQQQFRGIKRIGMALDTSLRAGLLTTLDPGNGGTIHIEYKGQAYCEAKTTGAETRVLPPAKNFGVGQELTVMLKEDGGNLTITGAADGNVILEDETDLAIFRVSAGEGGRADQVWRVVHESDSVGLTDGDKGDITVSGGGTVFTIDAGAVTFAKIQNVTHDRVLGRVSPGNGPVEEVVFLDSIQALADDATFADMRTTLGLGTIAVQNANNVAITGGSITGLQEFEVDSTNYVGYPVALNSTFTSSSNVTNFFDTGIGLLRTGSGNITNFIAADVFAINSNASGTVTNGVVVSSTFINTGTTTNAYGYRVDTLQNSGTIANTYGVYVGDITSGAQTNQAYSFYASDAGARSYFAGNTGFGTMTEPQETISSSGPICTYNTFVSASNYERGCIRFTANVFTIATEQAGAGTLRDMALLRGTVEHIRLKSTETVVNDTGSDIDFRVEGLGKTHMIFLDASASTENIALSAGSAPNWQTMNGGLFIGNAINAPTGNPANGYFLYGNAGVPTFRTSGGVITPIDFGIISSGTYTPTLTNVANLDGSTAYQCQFMRVGNTVTVSGKVDTNATAGGVATELGISLPVASNFGAEEDCAGVSLDTGLGERTPVKGDATNDRARMQWTAANDLNTWFFTFTYQII